MPVKIESLLEGMASSPPTMFFHLKKAIEDPRSSFEVYGNIIEADPAFSARLLKLVNSSFYGFQQKVESIQHALNIVGTEQLSDLLFSTWAIDRFKSIPSEVINMKEFWRHSIACAYGAKIIAEYKQEPDADKFYLAGLLHEIGSLVYYESLSDLAVKIIARAKEENKPLCEIEEEVLGFSHAHLGAEILKEWRLPDLVVEAVRYHHNPLAAKKFPLHAKVVFLADVIVEKMKLGHSGETVVGTISKEIMQAVNLPKFVLVHTHNEIQNSFDLVFDMYFGGN